MRISLIAFIVAALLSKEWAILAAVPLAVGAHRWLAFNRPIYVRERQVVARARRLGLARRK